MWKLADKQLNSRLLIGTANYPSLSIMQEAIIAAKPDVITVSIMRQSAQKQGGETFWQKIKALGCHVLPNTAGCRDANSAITMANLARELFDTNWIKLEVIGDEYNLQPDVFGLIEAARELINQGFEVFPYCTDDLVACQRLVDLGCRILMPWGSPIGSGKGLINPYNLMTIRERLPDVNLIIDAGLGKPSHATQAMEMGFDGVLLNTAIALANDPIVMANAFKHAVIAGREAYVAGMMQERHLASPSTALIDTPFWHQGLSNEI